MAATKKSGPAKKPASGNGKSAAGKGGQKSAPKNGSTQSRKSGAKSAPEKIKREKRVPTESDRQRKIIILFGAAAIFLAATLIKGEHLWLAIHNFFFGIFGITAFVWPLMFIYLAVTYVTKQSMLSEKSNIIGATSFVLLLSGIIHLFSPASAAGGLGAQIAAVWDGRENPFTSCGGFFGALFGGIPYLLFGKTAAAIVLIVLLVVVFALLARPLVFGFAISVKDRLVQKKDDFVHREPAEPSEGRRR